MVRDEEKWSRHISRIYALDSSEVKDLCKYLQDSTTFGRTTAACFEPHFAIIFFKEDSIAGVMDVCLDCNYLIANFITPTKDVFYGFSIKGRTYFKTLANKYHVPYLKEHYLYD